MSPSELFLTSIPARLHFEVAHQPAEKVAEVVYALVSQCD